jgi:DNA polymerase
MSDAYHYLLEATIGHLEQLKSRGVRFVSVSPRTLAGLGQDRPVGPAGAAFMPPARAPGPGVGPPPSRPAPPTPTLDTRPSTLDPPEHPLALDLPQPSTLDTRLPPPSPEAKAAAFAELRSQVMPCVKCARLAAARKNVVFGVGDINAKLMFVGEAPGSDEDDQGQPFVGKAGQLLTRIIQTMGLTRDSVYIANILKCRPDTPGQTSGNRKPTSPEMQTCLPYLHRQIDLIGPKVIVALGATAIEGLLGKTPQGITRLRGHWQTFRGIPLMPTYHPAYLLRNQSPAEKRKVWEDMLEVMAKLPMPVTEKQRNYFR